MGRVKGGGELQADNSSLLLLRFLFSLAKKGHQLHFISIRNPGVNAAVGGSIRAPSPLLCSTNGRARDVRGPFQKAESVNPDMWV